MQIYSLILAALSAAITMSCAAPASEPTPPDAPSLAFVTPASTSHPATASSAKSSNNLTLAGTDSLPQALLAVAPSSDSCEGAPIPSECRSASQAAPHIAASFSNYSIKGTISRAALIALMAYESGEFKYATNHFPAPGVKNQGCRNMQSPHFNTEFAAYTGVPIDLLQEQDETSFAAAAWFVTTNCQPSILHTLEAAVPGQAADAAWQDYMTCVGATDGSAKRTQYFHEAVQALS